MMRVIKERNPQSNIVAVDYDPGATKINQENRIKLMLANAASIAEQAGQAKRSRCRSMKTSMTARIRRT